MNDGTDMGPKHGKMANAMPGGTVPEEDSSLQMIGSMGMGAEDSNISISGKKLMGIEDSELSNGWNCWNWPY